MKSIVKFLGRVALVIILFSSAFIHLQQPEKFVTFYEIAYPEAKQLADGYGITFLPPVERVPLFLYSRLNHTTGSLLGSLDCSRL